jgi:hypothetical protein
MLRRATNHIFLGIYAICCCILVSSGCNDPSGSAIQSGTCGDISSLQDACRASGGQFSLRQLAAGESACAGSANVVAQEGSANCKESGNGSCEVTCTGGAFAPHSQADASVTPNSDARPSTAADPGDSGLPDAHTAESDGIGGTVVPDEGAGGRGQLDGSAGAQLPGGHSGSGGDAGSGSDSGSGSDGQVPPCSQQGQPCETGLPGRCAAGVYVCDRDVLSCAASEEPANDDVTCDGLDDDCDGEFDEDFESVGCGVGHCRATATWSTCVNGVEQECRTGAPLADTDQTCDAVDDDCDGAVDEEYPPTRICGIGRCAIESIASACMDGVEFPCTPGEPAQSDPTCDGLDDDCDGQVDEDYPSVHACGVGECSVGAAASSCVDGIETACSPGLPSRETCDDTDNDCDGSVDEDFALLSDTANCGACGNECAITRAARTACENGHCRPTCLDGWFNDDGNGASGCPCPVLGVDDTPLSIAQQDVAHGAIVAYPGNGEPGLAAWADSIAPNGPFATYSIRGHLMTADGRIGSTTVEWFREEQVEPGDLSIWPIPDGRFVVSWKGGQGLNRTSRSLTVDIDGSRSDDSVGTSGDPPYAWDGSNLVGGLLHGNEFIIGGVRIDNWQSDPGGWVYAAACPSRGTCFAIYARRADSYALRIAGQTLSDVVIAQDSQFVGLYAGDAATHFVLWRERSGERRFFRSRVGADGRLDGAPTLVDTLPQDESISIQEERILATARREIVMFFVVTGLDGRGWAYDAIWYGRDLAPTGRSVRLNSNCLPAYWADDEIWSCPDGLLISALTGQAVSPSYPGLIVEGSRPLLRSDSGNTTYWLWTGRGADLWGRAAGEEPRLLARTLGIGVESLPGTTTAAPMGDGRVVVVNATATELKATIVGTGPEVEAEDVRRLEWADGSTVNYEESVEGAFLGNADESLTVAYVTRGGVGSTVLHPGHGEVAPAILQPQVGDERNPVLAGFGGGSGWMLFTRTGGPAPALISRRLNGDGVIDFDSTETFERLTNNTGGQGAMLLALSNGGARRILVAWLDGLPGDCPAGGMPSAMWVALLDEQFQSLGGPVRLTQEGTQECAIALAGATTSSGFMLVSVLEDGEHRKTLIARSLDADAKALGQPFEVPRAEPTERISVYSESGRARVAWQATSGGSLVLRSAPLGCLP